MRIEETLTKEWAEFDGDYEKLMQDIKLKDGTVIIGCWPNAGRFMCITNKNQKDVLCSEVTHVRLTQSVSPNDAKPVLAAVRAKK